LEFCETDVLTSVTVLAVYVSQINDRLIDLKRWRMTDIPRGRGIVKIHFRSNPRWRTATTWNTFKSL